MDGPVTLADAKLYLRVDSADEDAIIRRFIRVAARRIETVYGLVAVQREISFTFDCFRPEMRIPNIPVKAGSIAVSYLDGEGTAQDFTDFRAFDRHDWTFIAPAIGAQWPTPAAAPGAISVTATLGYIDQEQSEEEQQAAVPDDLQQATLLMIEHLYRRIPGDMPPGMDALVDHYRWRRV